MRSAFTRRLVTAGLPIAALTAASSQVIAASRKPDAELLRLGEALSAAWTREIAAGADDDESRMDAAYEETAAIVDKIEALQATTLAGLVVKARACHWCRSGEPIEVDFFDNEPTTDSRLAAGILGDLVALGGAHA